MNTAPHPLLTDPDWITKNAEGIGYLARFCNKSRIPSRSDILMLLLSSVRNTPVHAAGIAAFLAGFNRAADDAAAPPQEKPVATLSDLDGTRVELSFSGFLNIVRHVDTDSGNLIQLRRFYSANAARAAMVQIFTLSDFKS